MIIELRENSIDSRKMQEIVDCLKNGGVIIYPTDTVYSFGCDLNNSKAIERIAKLKNIRADKANFSIVCADLSHLTDYSKQASNQVFKLMKSVLPGPYTFILNGSKNIPKIFSDRKKTIGIRVPANEIALTIVRELGRPIIATSVHDEDEVLDYTTDPELIHEKFEREVDIVIDGGPGGLEPSTILDCTGDEIVLLREGKGPIKHLLR
jgi:tRNA threonylcarbamoyl adenosine modification protein (Sua5/YciO/YrdC/YwlC family)